MVEGDRAYQHGEWRQGHHDAMVAMGAEVDFRFTQFGQFLLHGFHPIRLFEMQVVEAGETGFHMQTSAGGHQGRIEVGVVKEIERQGALLERDFPQYEVVAINKGTHA